MTLVQEKVPQQGTVIATAPVVGNAQLDTRSSIESTEDNDAIPAKTPQPPQTVYVQKVKRIKHRPHKVSLSEGVGNNKFSA